MLRRRGEKEECVMVPRGDRKNFGPPWKTRWNLKGGRRLVGRWACSRTGAGREREAGVGSRHAGTETRDAQVGK